MLPTAAKKCHRAIQIADSVKTDIALYQEAFTNKTQEKLIRNYPYIIKPKGKFGKINSGLLVCSKYPISNIEYLSFENRKGIDALCNKGAVKFRFTVDGKLYTVVNTHLQNHFHDITIQQVKELVEFSKDADLIAGDFNLTDIEFLEKSFGRKSQVTSPTFNNVVIDYVFTNVNFKVKAVKSLLSDHNQLMITVKF